MKNNFFIKIINVLLKSDSQAKILIVIRVINNIVQRVPVVRDFIPLIKCKKITSKKNIKKYIVALQNVNKNNKSKNFKVYLYNDTGKDISELSIVKAYNINKKYVFLDNNKTLSSICLLNDTEIELNFISLKNNAKNKFWIHAEAENGYQRNSIFKNLYWFFEIDTNNNKVENVKISYFNQ